jgi:hypothetical protein
MSYAMRRGARRWIARRWFVKNEKDAAKENARPVLLRALRLVGLRKERAILRFNLFSRGAGGGTEKWRSII